MSNFTAVANGAWNNPSTWGGSVPGTDDTILIPANITVDVDSSTMGPNGFGVFVQLGSQSGNGVLTVVGVLNVNVAASVMSGQDLLGIAVYMNSTLTVSVGGEINVSASGNVGSGTFNVFGIYASQSGAIVNNGTINLNCHNVNGGLGYGIHLDDSGTTLTNGGTINIVSSDPAKDGRGHCYGIRVRPGTVQNNGQITSTSQAAGTIKLEGGTLDNAGSFANSGLINNGGTINNTGALTQVFPSAGFQGNAIGGSGTVAISGTVTAPLSLDSVMPGISNYLLLANTSLTLNAPFTIPDGLSLDCKGALTNNSTFTNNGLIVWRLDTATFFRADPYGSQNDVKGSGRLGVDGILPSGAELDLNKLSQNITVLSRSIVISPGATLMVQRGDTMNIPSSYSVTVQGASATLPAGMLFVGGTIANGGTISNQGVIKYNLSQTGSTNWPVITTALTGNGAIALTGNAPSTLDLSAFPATNFLIMSGDQLDVWQGSTMTLPVGGTLTINGGATNGILNLIGTFNMNGSLTNSGTFQLGGTLISCGSIANNGSLECSSAYGYIVHCFPDASYSGTAPNGIVAVRLRGTTDSNVSLNLLGYGNSMPFRVASGDTLTVNGTLTVPGNYILQSVGTDSMPSTTSATTFTNSGTYVYNFDYASLSCTTYSGNGTVCLNGYVTADKSFASVTGPFGSSQNFTVQHGDLLGFCADTNMPEGITLSCSGTFQVSSSSVTVTLNTPPDAGADNVSATLSLQSNGTLENNGTIALRNIQRVGLWFHNMSIGLNPNNPTNNGTLDASTAAALSNNLNCSILIENTKLVNTSGTVLSGIGAIFCNQGSICGGTLTGSNPTGSPLPPSTATYCPSC